MKKLVATLLILITHNAYAEKIDVQCWSAGKEVFHKKLDKVFPGDNYVGASDKKYTYFLFANCIVSYDNKTLNKELKHKK